MLTHSSLNSDGEGFLDADETRRDLRPRTSPTSVFNKSKTEILPPLPSAESHEGDASVGNVPNVLPTTAGFSMSKPGSPGSLRLRSDRPG